VLIKRVVNLNSTTFEVPKSSFLSLVLWFILPYNFYMRIFSVLVLW
jgi:hypothetical protein